VRLARAAFEWAEFARQDDTRGEVADAGIAAARTAIREQPTNAAAHYWLGMDLGQLARTKSLGALKLVREMEEEFLRARTLDEHVDFAGPDRSLGLLYRDAPGWPASIGSKKKAREHLERAIQLHPEFPDNQLALLESLEQWGERQNFTRQLKVVENVLVDAKEKFAGPEWEQGRADWNKRFAALKEKSNDVGKRTGGKAVK
jgi:tetratricopeptide (TPR) repeat protein